MPAGNGKGIPPSTKVNLLTNFGSVPCNATATNAPIECPITSMLSTPINLITSAISLAWFFIPNGPGKVFDSPRPLRSTAKGT